VSLEVPADWTTYQRQANFKLIAGTRDGSTWVGIDFNAYPPEPFARFTTGVAEGGRQWYLSRHPEASFRWRTVALPAARGVELIVRTMDKRHPEAVHAFDLQHARRAYSFTYSTTAAKIGNSLPVFQRSARSIRFTG
jgi:hypothetical protein